MKKTGFIAASISALLTLSASAADIGGPPVVYPPVIDQPVVYHDDQVAVSSGWYLRGDAGYGFNSLRGITYSVSGGTKTFSKHDLKRSFSVGAGVGYRFNKRFRSDLTLDYLVKTKFEGATIGDCGVGAGGGANDCTSTDLASFSAWSLLANAYVDLFTYGRVTAYAGAGLGMTYMDWSSLKNTACLTATPTTCDATVTHIGSHGWHATAALMAGASVKITCALDVDVNYRYRYIGGGAMFGYSTGGGPGYHNAIHSHQGRLGLRYSFGGNDCGYIPPYEPPTLPPVYK